MAIEDAPAIQRYFDNWNIIQHLTPSVPWPYPPDGGLTHVRDTVLPTVASGASLTWAITEQTGGDELIGCIDFFFKDQGLGNRGFWLAEHLWGRGYMTEAVVAVQDHVLLDLGVERIVVMNSTKNPGSRRIKEKTGARLIGQVNVEHHNGVSLSDKWEVTREAWLALRQDGG